MKDIRFNLIVNYLFNLLFLELLFDLYICIDY
jgi:hypothetical protein